MDLVTTVRKEGSRGGRDAFTWDSVKADAHRENYLGHSLMAPVGRWQTNRDLNWYAKGDGDAASATAEQDARREEIRRIKEAEEDALSTALGLPVLPRRQVEKPRLEKGELDRVLGEAVGSGMGEEDGGVERGLGYGQFESRATGANALMVKGDNTTTAVATQGGLQGEYRRKEKRERRMGGDRDRDRDRDRHRHKEGKRRKRFDEEDRYGRRRSRSRSQDEHRRRRSYSRDKPRRRRSRSRGYEARKDRRDYERRRVRSRSPQHRWRSYSRDRNYGD